MDDFVDLITIGGKTGISLPTLRRYIKELKEQDPKAYKELTLIEPKKGKGKGKILYHEEDFIAFVLGYKAQKEDIRVANLKKGKLDTGQKAKQKPLQANVLIRKSKGGERFAVAKATKVNFVDMENPREVVVLLQSVCDLYATGAYSLNMACKEMGINVSGFWKMVALNDETHEIWDITYSRFITEHAVEMDYWIFNSTLEKIKSGKTQKVTTDYEYRVKNNPDGTVERVAIPVSKKVVEDDYKPSVADIVNARKLLLEIKHEARFVSDSKELTMKSGMTDEEYQAQIEELDRIIALEEAGNNVTEDIEVDD